jgi:hypothetical protein
MRFLSDGITVFGDEERMGILPPGRMLLAQLAAERITCVISLCVTF